MFCIRVAAKTGVGEYRQVAVSGDGAETSCDCGGFTGTICSHIDAVLVAGERAMVHPDDLVLADEAMALIAGRIVIPETWRGSWRGQMRWRGLSTAGSVRKQSHRDREGPTVCFTGAMRGFTRDGIKAQARQNGWITVATVSRLTDVLVAADPTENSGKLVSARKHGVPIVTPEQWALLMTDGVLPAN